MKFLQLSLISTTFPLEHVKKVVLTRHYENFHISQPLILLPFNLNLLSEINHKIKLIFLFNLKVSYFSLKAYYPKMFYGKGSLQKKMCIFHDNLQIGWGGHGLKTHFNKPKRPTSRDKIEPVDRKSISVKS